VAGILQIDRESGQKQIENLQWIAVGSFDHLALIDVYWTLTNAIASRPSVFPVRRTVASCFIVSERSRLCCEWIEVVAGLSCWTFNIYSESIRTKKLPKPQSESSSWSTKWNWWRRVNSTSILFTF
jgi:hypothetical protein